MNRTMLPIRLGVGVAFGFAAGLALADKMITGDTTDWAETGLLGWGILAGTAIGLLVGYLMMRWLRHRLATRTTPWILFGLALGPLCALVIHAAFWDMGASVAGISAGVGAIGLWNGLLLGLALGNRLPDPV